jgi:hypothetical protein
VAYSSLANRENCTFAVDPVDYYTVSIQYEDFFLIYHGWLYEIDKHISLIVRLVNVYG